MCTACQQGLRDAPTASQSPQRDVHRATVQRLRTARERREELPWPCVLTEAAQNVASVTSASSAAGYGCARRSRKD